MKLYRNLYKATKRPPKNHYYVMIGSSGVLYLELGVIMLCYVVVFYESEQN
jgi:hypothetical protein